MTAGAPALRAQVSDAVALFAACGAAPYSGLRDSLFQHLRRSIGAMSGRALLRLVVGLEACRCAAERLWHAAPFRQRVALWPCWMRGAGLASALPGLQNTARPRPRLPRRLRPDAEVVHHLVTALQQQLPGYSRAELAQLARALRRVFRILPGRPLRALVEDMRRREGYLAAAGA
jgi:hypothetical protein